MQVARHVPGPHTIEVAQALEPQVTSHADDVEQFTPLLQAPEPQVTWHGPAPHKMGEEHAFEVQSMSQRDAAVQLSVLRQPPDGHAMRQGMPGGHVTGLLQLVPRQS